MCEFVSTDTNYYVSLPPAKRSLGQGNSFTSVCHSVHRGRGSLSGGVTVQGVSIQGGLYPGGLCLGDPLDRDPPHTVKSGRYAYYLNANLLKMYIVMNTLPTVRRTWLYIFTPTSPGTLHSQWQPTLKNDFKVKAYLLLFSHVSYVNIIRLDWIDNAIFFCS